MIVIAITLFAVIGHAAASPLLKFTEGGMGRHLQQNVLAQIDSNG